MRETRLMGAASILALAAGSAGLAPPALAQTKTESPTAVPAPPVESPVQEIPASPVEAAAAIMLPPGYEIEKVAEGLTYPTSVTWDDQGRMYIAEAGGGFLEEEPPARILRIEDNGDLTEIANLDEKGIRAAVAGMIWHDGAFYFTHRADDRSGAVSRMTMDGQVELLFKGIIDSKTDHQVNGIRVGPDGRMYVASGGGGNSAVMGQDMTPFVLKSPDAHTTVCEEVVLLGKNFLTPDFRSKAPGDEVLTGAFVPFGTPTEPGQVIEGTNMCGGAILAFDPNNAEATIEPYAWGFRNIIGMAWGPDGEMYATQNGYDVVPSRPVLDEYDPTYRVREGEWYGWPDFSAALEPLTDPKFEAPGSLRVPTYIDGELQPGNLGFLIDHEASGLDAPDPSLVLGLHPLNSSPSKPDVAPASWGEFAGDLFVPEWGDLAWFTNATREDPVGYQVVRIDTETGERVPFAWNSQPGPASAARTQGPGIERPFDVKFGPDGAMYIVDFGIAKIVLRRIAEGNLPYEFPPETGVIWKVSQTEQRAGAEPGSMTGLYDEWAGEDGKLTVEEWDTAIDTRFGEQAVNLDVAQWDADGDGLISREDFDKAAAQSELLSKAQSR